MNNLSKEQFKVLFDMHFDAIRRYLYYRCADSELASDVAQDLFMRIWEKQMSIDPVKDRALLYKIASDMIVSKFRRKKREVDFSSSVSISGAISDTNQNIEYSELARRYSETLTKMGEKQRVAFLMSRNEDLKYEEIAVRLKISVKAVEKRISAALSLLKRDLNY
ncbi:MAG: sigma-70 family RNA polymerase sigma factor [Bacteroidales bacterium]|nr:sigma-70 family RNA polymerase sigma factor [Bacteroidales bacterium]MDD3273002.1 sigma-70 family RNA polymerase sigma factor [Bacteroidales bacterium]MDD4058213.1 sigma-70 family RNA polymerase sigma factor [Bacteroidales bacterium]